MEHLSKRNAAIVQEARIEAANRELAEIYEDERLADGMPTLDEEREWAEISRKSYE